MKSSRFVLYGFIAGIFIGPAVTLTQILPLTMQNIVLLTIFFIVGVAVLIFALRRPADR